MNSIKSLSAAITRMIHNLLGRQPGGSLTPSPPAHTSESPSRIVPLLALFVSLLLTVPLIDFGVYYLYAPKIEQDTYSNLRLIAKIKVVQYERWRESRKGDAEVLAADKSLAEQVQAFQTKAATEAGRRIGERFDALIAAYGYEGISLVDLHGDEILRRGITIAADPIQRLLMQQTLATGKVSNSDLYLVGNNRIQFDLMAPVTVRAGTQATIIGFVIIHTGLDRLVLPHALSWPRASSSAEVLMVSAEGSTENIISASRKNKKQLAVIMRALTTDSPYTSSRRLQKGKDYHGKTIFSVHESLNKSAWSIITQIDKKEVMAPLTTLLLWVSLIALIAVSLVALTLTTLWRQQRRTYELQLIADSTERDRLLKRFYDLPFVGMGIISADSRLWTQANDHLCEILGYARTELLQHTYNQITHPDDVVADLEYYECFVRRDIKYYQHEKRFLHKSGKVVFTRVAVNCAFTPSGEIEMLLVTVEDITERKLTEEALRKSEERLSLIIKGTNDGWWDLDLLQNGAYHSPRWWAMLGYEPDWVMSDPTLWQRITHPDDIEPSLKLIREALASDQNSYEIELRLLHCDGHYVPILTRAFILRNDQGQAVRISGSNMDLTQRHATEAALRNQEEFNRVLLENQAESVVACDADSKLVLFNRTAREWHGLDAASIPPEQWSHHFGLYDAKGEHELAVEQIPLIRAFNGEHLQHISMAIKAHGQETRFVSCSAAPFFDSSGKKLGAVAIFRDQTAILRHSQTLQASEALYREMFAANPLPMWVFDVETLAFLAVNDAAIGHYGWSREEFLAMKITDIRPADEVERLQQYLSQVAPKDLNTSGEWKHLKKNGTVMNVEITSHSLNFSGRDACLMLAYDITERKHNEESLRMAAAVFENTREGIMVTDADNRIILVNRAFTDITLYQEEDVLGQSPALLVSGRHDHQFYEEMWQTLTEIGYWQGEIWNRRGDGDVHPVLMGISTIKNEAGLNYVAVFADISNLKASEAQLEFLAHHDPLTRLPNRLMLISQLGHAIKVARRDKSQLALLMLDLDRFKNVNDSFGHPAGDELLQQVAKRLRARLREVDIITRLGGDEFTVLLQDVAHPEDAARVAENIIEALQASWTLANNIEVHISASIGISLYPEHGETALELLQHADAALYQAKSAGRGCARYFSESLTKAARDRLDIEARLRRALQNNELRVYYQPKIDMVSGKIVGAEALVRWQDPVEGLILPVRFISIAEDTGLIGAIGAWVMHEACRQGKSWLDSSLAPLSIAVNLSANQLHHGDIVETVCKVLDETGFPPHLLELELTESILMQREDEMVDTLNDLRSKGVTLAIDDFGTGYSSLAYLKSFPLDVLKVDRSFVADLEEDEDDRAITAAIIGIAHTLDMKVVAEGVETVHQREFLRAHGCDMYQGYLVSKPVPADEFAVFLQVYNAAN